MKKFGNVALIAVAMAMLTCVGMWGCSDWFPEDGEREFFDYFSDSQIVGFIDDSLVIVADDKEWSQETSDGYAIGGRGHQRLRVFNYRVQENGPRWTDTLDNFNEECNYVLGQLSDSVIWGGRTARYTKVWKGPVMTFWKIGGKPVVHQISVKMEGCEIGFPVESLRDWLDGLILSLGTIYSAPNMHTMLNAGGDTCQYAVLDTVAKTLTYKRLDENLKWIQKCDDVRAWGDDVICSVAGKRLLEGNILKNEKDTLLAPLAFSKGIFWGNMIELRANICSLGNQEISCLDSAFTWREPLKFYKGNDVVVNLE
ncbi:hypothetical protein [Fibrobacter intestinalis]|uniref:Uncharacterized protein n=1 Tax=Fibrobacter intestinalis TaxID=28122 RepID=A0A1T4RM73_9BACT|nr:MULTISPECIES: hypothetical protein [Fibrobacter]PBC72745.1 hypothetical protein BGW94_0323 [Fibrobacter sp. NR9]SKA17105.1 hypothetical protein SAMN02745108_02773 [Fibrobacter intestinalis]